MRAPCSTTVRDLYARSGRTLLPPLGFDNTFAILVRASDARAREPPDDRGRGARSAADGVPDSATSFSSGRTATRDWRRRTGCGLPRPPRVMDLALSYRALASGQVDLIAGDATAGLIQGLDLVQLEDNRHYFPPYDAAPVARAETLLRYPQVRAALERLAGALPPPTCGRSTTPPTSNTATFRKSSANF